jgi:voltage-gated potassium channel
MADTGSELGDLKGHILICGWSPVVQRILDGLAGNAQMAGRVVVLVNQADPGEIQDLRIRYPQLQLHHVVGQYQVEATLRRAHAATCASAIVVADLASGPDPDSRTIICTLAIENMNTEAKTCAELLDKDNEPNLKRAGVDEIVVTGENSGFFLSSGALSPGIAKAARKLITFRSGSEMRRETVPQEFLGKTFGDLQEHVRLHGAMLIGVIREAAVPTIEDILGGGNDWIDVFIKTSFETFGQDVLDREKDRIQVIVNPPDTFELEYKDSAILIGGSVSSS